MSEDNIKYENKKKNEEVVVPETVEVYIPNIIIPDGWYHLIKIDEEGKEIQGTDVAIAESMFLRSFKALTEGEKKTYKVVALPKKKK